LQKKNGAVEFPSEKPFGTKYVPGEYMMVYRSINQDHTRGIKHLKRKRRSGTRVTIKSPTYELKILGVKKVNNTCCQLSIPKPSSCCQPPRPYCKNTKGNFVPCPD